MYYALNARYIKRKFRNGNTILLVDVSNKVYTATIKIWDTGRGLCAQVISDRYSVIDSNGYAESVPGALHPDDWRFATLSPDLSKQNFNYVLNYLFGNDILVRLDSAKLFLAEGFYFIESTNTYRLYTDYGREYLEIKTAQKYSTRNGWVNVIEKAELKRSNLKLRDKHKTKH